MTDWQQIRALFDAAVELPPAERERWLAAADGDEAARAAVRRLLAAHERAGSFMVRPALDDWAARAAPELVGQRLGAYQVLSEIGRGAMGVVYLAARADGAFDKQVAIKLLHTAGASEALKRRFDQECRILARLEHYNVARLLDAGVTADGQPYFVMEYVAGQSLRQLLAQRGALPLGEVLELTKQIGAGLAAAHRLGIVHRDLKPANLMVREDDGTRTVKLLDFGIARLLAAGAPEEHTQTGVVLGTAAYLAPEQAAGATGEKIDARADIYALGMIVYELLTGRTAFQGDSSLEVLHKHLYEAPPPLRRVRPDLHLPGAVERVVLKALSKERAARQQTVAEFVAELEAAGNQALNQPPRKRTKLLGWLLACAVGMAIVWWWFAQRGGLGNPEVQSVAPAAPAAQSVLWYRVIKEDARGNAATLVTENIVRAHERIHFEFKLARPGQLYLLYQERDGTLVWIDPAPSGRAAISPADEWLRIPANATITMDDQIGAQRYWLIYVPGTQAHALWADKPEILQGEVPHAIITRAAATQLDYLRRAAVSLSARPQQSGTINFHELSQPGEGARLASYVIELQQVR